MAIITTDKVRDLLQISDYQSDNLIDTLIPAVQNWVVEYLQNWFHGSDYISASTIAFVDSSPDTITDSDSGFVTAGFVDSIDIHVTGSDDNDGIYAVDTVAAGTLTLASGEELVAEAVGNGVRITRVFFPKGLWMPVAQLIKFDMQKRDPSITSRSLGDFSESYAGMGDYPPGLLSRLGPWKKLRNES